MNPNQRHPLLGKFDADPGRWRPMWYGVEISVGIGLNAVGRGSVTINNQPYILTRITHQIIGNTADPETSGLYQDGQYAMAFKDEQSNYQNIPIPAEMMHGSVRSGFSYEFPYPLPFAGNKTLSFELYNRVVRVLAGDPPPEYFTVAIALHGIADWGTVTPQGR